YFVPSYATFTMSPVYSVSLTTGSYLTPASVPASSGTGFTSGPYISYYYGSSVRLTATPQVSGTMYYAVVASDYYPEASEIATMTSTGNAKCYSKGYVTVTAGTEVTTGTLSVPSVTSGYKIVAVLRATNGTYYIPVSSSIASKNVLYAYTPNNSSGFASGTPYVYSISSDKRTVTLAATPLYTGTVYYAVVDSSFNPTAEQIASLTTASAYCYATGYRSVTANTSYADLTMTIKNYSTVTSGMKVVAVLRTSTGYYLPVSGSIITNGTLNPYTNSTAPTAVLNTTVYDGKISNIAPLTLQFSELMYCTGSFGTGLISAQTEATLKSLFTLQGYNTATGQWTTITSSWYDVTASDVSGKTLVTFEPATGKAWPTGYAIRVYVSSSVVNASRLTVQPSSGYYETAGIIESSLVKPSYSIELMTGVTGTVVNGTTVYIEAGTTGFIATLEIIKQSAEDKIYYKVDGGSAVEYTGPSAIKVGTSTIEFWAQRGTLTSPTTTITIVEVAKPVVKLNSLSEGKWIATSNATIAAESIPSGATLYIGGKAGENTLAEVVRSTVGETYLAADGKSLVTQVPDVLTVASGTELSLYAVIKIGGDVVAESETVTVTISSSASTEPIVGNPTIQIIDMAGDYWGVDTHAIVFPGSKLLPDGYAYLVELKVNGMQTDTRKFIDDTTPLYVNSASQIVTTEPENTLANGQKIEITVYVVPNNPTSTISDKVAESATLTCYAPSGD
ncbi:MAG: hypothetical protein ACI4QB_02025, partial [Eubacteriales bacterium]